VAAIALMIGRSRTYRPSLWARIFLSESWKLVLSASSSDRIRLQLAADVQGGDKTSHRNAGVVLSVAE